MSKYNITITEINTSNNTHEAKGFLVRNGEEIQFEAQTIWWEGTRRWKVKEEAGVAVAVEKSAFTTGERMGIARWLKEVTSNPELLNKSSGQGNGSQGSQRTSSSNARVQELESQNKALQDQMLQLQMLMNQVLSMQELNEEEVAEVNEETVVEETPAKKPKKSK